MIILLQCRCMRCKRSCSSLQYAIDLSAFFTLQSKDAIVQLNGFLGLYEHRSGGITLPMQYSPHDTLVLRHYRYYAPSVHEALGDIGQISGLAKASQNVLKGSPHGLSRGCVTSSYL